jgi:guanyl-specific ribonuclease Sa
MRVLRSILLIAVGLFILYVKLVSNGPGTASGPSPVVTSSMGAPTNGAVPDKALQVLDTVRKTGQPPEGYVGGRTFENRENRLPAAGDYREFDVDPHNGQRNAERIIVEWTTKKAWYTGDHYQTFIPLP